MMVRARGVTATAIALVAVLAIGQAVAKKPPASVKISGTAYEFNNVDTFPGGGKVKVAEFPKLSAPIASNGAYSIKVPNRAKVTLYAVKTGYHSIYTQTFRTNGADLVNVNLQTPTTFIYNALAGLLEVPLDASRNPKKCVIVSTFSTRNVRGLDYAGFVGYGAHGVAGASASASPALPEPIYFNDQVVPDPAQIDSSEDGGVVWTGVPAGVYRVSASKTGTRFADFTATCRNGRVVNANPPWGLHEQAENNPTSIQASWQKSGRGRRLSSLTATGVPVDPEPSTQIGIRCNGKKCPFAPFTYPGAQGYLDLLGGFAAGAPTLLPGQTLEVTVTSPGPGDSLFDDKTFNGWVYRWSVGTKGVTQQKLCLPLGETKPTSRCS